MISINSLYEIISQLPFSIKGYQSDSAIDYHLNRLLDKMHEQKQNFANLNVRFFSFANARLADVLKWHLADYDKSFYFVPFIYSSNEDLYLNEYYSLKKVIKEYSTPCTSDKSWNEIVMSGKAAQISSVLFKTPIVYRVLCDDNVTDFSITYESGCISILIPSNCFSFYDQNKLPDEDSDYLPLIKKDNEYIPNENARKYRPLCEDGFTRYDYKRINNKIVEGLKNINIEHTIFKLYDEAYLHDAITGFANLLITHAYLSLILECWVESIPSVVNIDKKETNSLGIVIWGYNNECNISECRSLIQIIADKICTSFSAHFVDLLGLVNITQKESLKSAKAAIMSRNMSHNLGSHVMFYIKQKLQSVSKIVDNKVLENIIPGNIATIADIEENIKANKDIELPFLVGLGRFINYLQERQDYIATVATDYIPARSTISFKDFIYDELKPDLRYRRHHIDNPDGEAGWAPGNLLLDYIAYSEGYKSSDEIIIKFKDFNGENPKENGEESEDFQELRKFNVALPGGVIGRQAIFSIFENIIRNAAKHSKRRDDNKMVLQLSLLDVDKDKSIFENSKNFCSKLYDNSTKSIKSIDNLFDLYKQTSNKYHFLCVKLDMPNSSDGVDKLLDNLADPYLEDNGSMKETAKGLKEMRISAAWLRGYSIDTEIDVSKEPPVLSVYSEKYCKDSIELKTISYILCIPKPCRVAFVVEHVSEDYAILNKQLESLGCKVYGCEDDVKSDVALFSKRIDGKNIINSAIPDYEIICFLTDLNVEDEVYQQISSRYINNHKITEEILKQLKDCEGDVDKLKSKIDTIYEVWYNKWFEMAYPNCTDRKLTILDDRVHDDYIIAQNKANIKEKFPILDDDKSKKSVLVDSTGNITQEYCTAAVVYKTHFKGMRNESKGSHLAGANFIESITGNNSTARIIRQDKWNKLWKYKLLFSGHAKVAIFDERIYDTFVATKGSVDSKKVYDLLANKSKSQEDKVSTLQELGFTEDESCAIVYRDAGYEKYINNRCEEYDIDVAQQNHERRTWAFNVKIEHNGVVIMGYNVPIDNNVGNFVLNTPPEIIVAKIKQDGEGYCVELCDKGKVFLDGKANVFDFITIHLGILDKIYNAFGVKGNEEEMLKITNAIHKCFVKANTPSDYKEFLPNFIIHSGRSKPSKKDMPQKQPFVQFAALDYAVKDCKYTLIELLTTAHYE